MLTCACCEHVITRQRAGYRARLGLFEDVTLITGQPAAVRVGWCDRALCRSCLRRIEAAHEARIAARRRAAGRPWCAGRGDYSSPQRPPNLHNRIEQVAV